LATIQFLMMLKMKERNQTCPRLFPSSNETTPRR
jgi:hypothetical protein